MTTTHTRTALETVQAMYEAFGQGDFSTMFTLIDHDVDWGTIVHAPGAAAVPMFGNGTGHAAVRRYFEGVAELEFHRFEPTRFIVDGEAVGVDLNVDISNRRTGRRASFEEVHRFDVRNGLVIRFRGFNDTGSLIELYRD